jgi:hypothetical protein
VTGLPVCPACHRAIRPGWVHENQPQPEGSNVIVCGEHRERREPYILKGPLLEVLNRYFDVGEAQMAPLEWLHHKTRERTP